MGVLEMAVQISTVVERRWDGDGEKEEEEGFGPTMKYVDIMRETEECGAKLPADILEAAKTAELPRSLFVVAIFGFTSWSISRTSISFPSIC